jgi:5-methylcytosine-specific restriction endonuclease McrA
MPRKRLPRELWYGKGQKRERVWRRDGGRCQGPYCKEAPPLALTECHVDHIVSGKRGTNEMSNLRILCRRCHVLRSCHRHQGMIAKALADGIIPFNWREYVWD